MLKNIIKVIKQLFENRNKSLLEKYIIDGNPQSTYDVEKLHYEFQQKQAKSIYHI